MKITNMTDQVRLTWDGKTDVPPGATIDTSTLTDVEAKWHLRHGFKEVKPKPKPAPKIEAHIEVKPRLYKPKSKIHRRAYSRSEE